MIASADDQIKKDRELFLEKNEWLNTYFEEVSARDFYRDLFPAGSFEREGHYEDKKSNGIVTFLQGERMRNLILLDNLQAIDEVQGAEFAVTIPVGFIGRRKTKDNARVLYGIGIDLDGVASMDNLRDVFHQMQHGFIPQCSYCINSGHGLHLYYLLDEPVAIHNHLQIRLKEFKYELIRKIWNPYTSAHKERNEAQYQGILQPLRIVGTQTKLGADYLVTAFCVSRRVSIDYLNTFVRDNQKILPGDLTYKKPPSQMSLFEAKEKYPEWHETRIIKKQMGGRWHIKRDLYDWWLHKIKHEEVTIGHRYWCLAILAIYAKKCDVPIEEVTEDALSIRPMFDAISTSNDNRFTTRDVKAAMKLYNENYVKFSRDSVQRYSGLSVPTSKRNYRKQRLHLKIARSTLEIMNEECGKILQGRPKGSGTKAELVARWQAEHPAGRKIDCERDLGLSRHTVLKWWR